MRKTLRTAVVLIAALAVGVLAYSRWSDGRRVNVLLITLDTTRADHVGCYGYAAARTPVLDAFAAEGTRFSRAYCNVPLTLPSHATIMTGLHPVEHGCRINGLNALAKDVPTLAETLAARGYATAAFVGAVVLNASFGLDRGFDVYDDFDVPGGIDPRDDLALIRDRRGDKVADAALGWLTRRPDKPFFCWVHFFDPHRPYYLDEPLDPPDPIVAYDREIAYMDRQIGRLLDYLRDGDLLKSTVVVIVGDHGEGLNQHGEDEHGLLLYEESLHVPLIVRPAHRRPPAVVHDATVSLVDLLPTLLDLLHVKPVTPLSGRSLAGALQGRPLADQPVFAETQFPLTEYGWSALSSVRSGPWKYIRAPREELYDLGADRGETNDMAATRLAVVEELRALLTAHEARMKAASASIAKIDATARRALESLGYVGGGSVETSASTNALRDPKDGIWMRRAFLDAQEDAREGRAARAEKVFQELIRESPESMAFHYNLGKLYYEGGRFEPAREVFAEMARRFPENYAPHYDLGKTLIRLKAFGPAIEELAVALELDSQRPEILNNLGLAHLYNGDAESAMQVFARSIALDANQVEPHSNLGHLLLQSGDVERAMDEFRAALAIDGSAFGPRYNLGVALLQAGRAREAVRELEQAVQLRPDFAEARNRLELARDQAKGL